jgi:PAS domain-containing protein
MARKNNSTSTSGDLRKQAERVLNLEAAPLREMSEDEVAALMHELRVHQVELEMQNESLRQAQVEMEQSRTKYAELFDFAPVGYLVFDGDGMVVEANLTAAGMLQIERGRLIKKVFGAFVQPATRDTWLFHHQAVFRSGQPQECDLELKRKDRAEVVVRLRSEPVKNDGQYHRPGQGGTPAEGL